MASLREVPPDTADDAPVSDSEDPHGVDMWIMPYLRDSSLWPVLVVLVLHVVAFVVPVLLFAARDRRTGAIFALGVLMLLTLRGFRWEIRSREKFGAISWLIVATWITSLLAAYLANRYDFL
jgi:hypothetical protein